MTNNFNQIGRAGTVAATIVLFFLLNFPAIVQAAPEDSTSAPAIVTLQPGVTGAEIQQALDGLPAAGGQVILPSGKISIFQPIVLDHDFETLRGSGAGTVLWLTNDANCPVIIMGEPVNNPKHTIGNLCVRDLFIDGNRSQQHRELWKVKGEGSDIRNNGITVQNVTNSTVEHVTCTRCRSGGLVTTRNVRQLTVYELDSSDNQFDGLACYQTAHCLFTELNLHNNPGAGISLDLSFSQNVISNAVLTADDLGIFMRSSCSNQFYNVSMRDCHHHGVFMAQELEETPSGWGEVPRTECTRNSFTNLIAIDCGGPAFRVNDTTCTNNIIVQANFKGNPKGGLSQVEPDLVLVR
jgi:hypothetical protein